MTINLPLGNLSEGLKNKHVSIPAVLAAGAELIRLWAPAWYAAHEQAIQGTQKVLFAYAALQASASVPQATKNDIENLKSAVRTGDTSIIERADAAGQADQLPVK